MTKKQEINGENKKTCNKCFKFKIITDFVLKKYKKGTYYLNTCKMCYSVYNKKYLKSYYEENKNEEEFRKKRNQYTLEHKSEKSDYDKIYNAKPEIKLRKQEYDKKYRTKNKIKIKNRTSSYWKERKAKDPALKLRKNISFSIWFYLNKNSSSKNKNSIIKFLPFSIEELKIHLEKTWLLPENLTSDGQVWMNWKNYGKYNAKKWKDNDFSTYTWNIDHIIPQSQFPFVSMEDENFFKIWSLENIRAFSSKQNLIEGNRQTKNDSKDKNRTTKKKDLKDD